MLHSKMSSIVGLMFTISLIQTYHQSIIILFFFLGPYLRNFVKLIPYVRVIRGKQILNRNKSFNKKRCNKFSGSYFTHFEYFTHYFTLFCGKAQYPHSIPFDKIPHQEIRRN